MMIRSRLDEIEREEPQCAAFVREARMLVRALRLNDYMRPREPRAAV
jgi:hypothetical protein